MNAQDQTKSENSYTVDMSNALSQAREDLERQLDQEEKVVFNTEKEDVKANE